MCVVLSYLIIGDVLHEVSSYGRQVTHHIMYSYDLYYPEGQWPRFSDPVLTFTCSMMYYDYYLAHKNYFNVSQLLIPGLQDEVERT
jgi:hypothetical protein